MSILEPDYWNNKWPKAPIIYNGRTLKNKNEAIGIDVKNFIEHDDAILQSIIQIGNLKKSNFDETVHAIQQWVCSYLTYVGDDTSVSVPEYWQFPFETFHTKAGDCEDGAILIASLCRNAGIPSWRIKVAAGFVQPEPTAPQGGHGYCLYLADDADWRIIDWCYFADPDIPIKDKPLAKNGGQRNSYKQVWFTFNDEYSWNQTTLEISYRLSSLEFKI